MAKATLTYPFAALHGTLRPSDRYYCRMLNGRCILQRKPRRSSPAQQAMRRAFAQRYKGAHPSPLTLHPSPISSPRSTPVAPDPILI